MPTIAYLATLILAALLGGGVAIAVSASVAPPAAEVTQMIPAAAEPIVGSWSLDVNGAPYGPHLIQFHADGTLTISNPTDVQSKAGKDGSPGTWDSPGYGAWQPWHDGGYMIQFAELNAFATGPHAGTPAPTLIVVGWVDIHGDDLTGRALAGLGSNPLLLSGQTRPAGFKGKRMHVDMAAAEQVNATLPAGVKATPGR